MSAFDFEQYTERDLKRFSQAHPYHLRHTATGLLEAGEYERLYRLLVGNSAWMQTKLKSSSGHQEYANELEQAIAQFTDPLTGSESLTLLQLRAAIAVVNARIGEYTDEDLETLTYLGWQDEALSHARMRSTAEDRFAGFEVVLRILAERDTLHPEQGTMLLSEARQISHFPKRIKAISETAAIMSRAGDDRAESLLDELLHEAALHDADAESWCDVAQSLIRSGQPAKAHQILQQHVVRMEPLPKQGAGVLDLLSSRFGHDDEIKAIIEPLQQLVPLLADVETEPAEAILGLILEQIKLLELPLYSDEEFARFSTASIQIGRAAWGMKAANEIRMDREQGEAVAAATVALIEASGVEAALDALNRVTLEKPIITRQQIGERLLLEGQVEEALGVIDSLPQNDTLPENALEPQATLLLKGALASYVAGRQADIQSLLAKSRTVVNRMPLAAPTIQLLCRMSERLLLYKMRPAATAFIGDAWELYQRRKGGIEQGDEEGGMLRDLVRLLITTGYQDEAGQIVAEAKKKGERQTRFWGWSLPRQAWAEHKIELQHARIFPNTGMFVIFKQVFYGKLGSTIKRIGDRVATYQKLAQDLTAIALESEQKAELDAFMTKEMEANAGAMSRDDVLVSAVDDAIRGELFEHGLVLAKSLDEPEWQGFSVQRWAEAAVEASEWDTAVAFSTLIQQPERRDEIVDGLSRYLLERGDDEADENNESLEDKVIMMRQMGLRLAQAGQFRAATALHSGVVESPIMAGEGSSLIQMEAMAQLGLSEKAHELLWQAQGALSPQRYTHEQERKEKEALGLRLAIAQAKAGDFSGAWREFNTGGQYYQDLGELLFVLSAPAQPIETNALLEMYQRTIGEGKLPGGNPVQALAYLAVLLYRAGCFEEAKDTLDGVFATIPTTNRWYFSASLFKAAAMLAQSGGHDEASALLAAVDSGRSGYQHDSGYTRVLHKAMTLALLGRAEEAAEAFAGGLSGAEKTAEIWGETIVNPSAGPYGVAEQPVQFLEPKIDHAKRYAAVRQVIISYAEAGLFDQALALADELGGAKPDVAHRMARAGKLEGAIALLRETQGDQAGAFIAELLAEEGRLAEAWRELGESGLDEFLLFVMNCAPPLQRIEPGLGFQSLLQAIRIAGWVRLDWRNVFRLASSS